MSDFDVQCGCSPEIDADLSHVNAPGKSAIAYRLGTHGIFYRRMLEALPVQTVEGSPAPPLAALNVRDAGDPAVAILDAWAVVGDVLTFYQERIANEGYLRTATERRSVLELGRGVGYELAPGVAASAFLAFTVEDTTPKAIVPRGTRVQSLPGQGQVPQPFETSADIEARAEWNKLRPRRTQPQIVTIGEDGQLRLRGDKSRLDAIYLKGTSTNLRAGDVLLIVIGDRTATADVHRVVPEPAAGRTRVELVEEPRSAPQGLLSPNLRAEPINTNLPIEQQDFAKRTITEEALRAYLVLSHVSGEVLTRHINAEVAEPEQSAEVYAFRQRVSFFGHNAQPFKDTAAPKPSPPTALLNPNQVTAWNDAWDTEWKALTWDVDLTIWSYSTGAPWPADVHAFLERTVTEITPGSWVLLRDPRLLKTANMPFRVESVVEASVADYGFGTKATGLIFSDPADRQLRFKPDPAKLPFGVRTSSALVQAERLDMVDIPLVEALAVGERVLALDRFVLGLRAGQPLWIQGERDDLRGTTTGEIALLSAVVHDKGRTTLLLQDGLRFAYVRDTVVLNANIAVATHGETVASDVLGSGDASRANQRFILKKQNITHLSAPTATGVASTVSIRVNGVPWREVPSLHDQDASAQVYSLSVDNEGVTAVTFGDGQNGARLPTGTENVVASYRTGVTTAGAVAAGSLSLLQTRPLGISAVRNPFASTGAEGPDSLEEGRVNAPFAVRTLGRVVTLEDYEDFVRAFGGVGKSKAAVLSKGSSQIVHISAVSDRGEPIDRLSDLHRNLQKALFEVSDPLQEVQIDGADVLTFEVAASLIIDPRRASAEVLSVAAVALLSAFALEKRDLGRSVTPAEVINALQRASGVIAVILDRLSITGRPALGDLLTLPALPARVVGGVIRPAEILLINPLGITLTEVSA